LKIRITSTISLGLLSHLLFRKNIAHGRELIVSGALIWLTNILIFALYYWQPDRCDAVNARGEGPNGAAVTDLAAHDRPCCRPRGRHLVSPSVTVALHALLRA
jgi:hypothetical protein